MRSFKALINIDIDTNDDNENYHFNKIYFGGREVINVRSCRALIRSVFCADTAVVPETYGHMYSTNTFTIFQPILLLLLKLSSYSSLSQSFDHFSNSP